jgi:spore coat polysaccharide biosynthesis predicted glycosyltransferase SpsG/RimJ/RimL family protein N-acetyltransferase|tara:strand:- start:2381 stop:3895 length:1515 start_codon:yes stop_codon:yes gene_type:complete
MNFIIRVDYSDNIGIGHLKRMTYLADNLLKKKHKVIFVLRRFQTTKIKKDFIKKYSIKFIDSVKNNFIFEKKFTKKINNNLFFEFEFNFIMKLIEKSNINFLVFDTPYLNEKNHIKLNGNFKKILITDKGYSSRYFDYILNSRIMPNGVFKPKSLIGPKFSIVDQNFVKYRKTVPSNKKILKMIIFFGNSDNKNILKKICIYISEFKNLSINVDILIGKNYKNLSQIKDIIDKNNILRIKYFTNNFTKLLYKYDFCILSSGVSLSEALTLKIPTFLITNDISQNYFCKLLNKQNLLYFYSHYSNITKNSFKNHFYKFIHTDYPLIKKSLISSNLFDGYGSDRLIEILASNKKLKIKKATPNDILVLYEWSNSSDVRYNSQNTDPITFKDHYKWFNSSLVNSNRFIYLAYLNNLPVGQIRFDYIKNNIFIDYSIDHHFRNLGFGSDIIRLGINKIETKDYTLKAIVKKKNRYSAKAFENNNFLLSINKDFFVYYKKNLISNNVKK